MAKKKKPAKKTSRRRSVGAAKLNPNSTIVKIGAIAGGFLLGDKINAAIDKVTGGKIDDKIVGGAMGVGGAYYLFMHKGKKNLLMTIGTGVAAGAGAKRLMKSLGIGSALAGYGRVPVIGNRRMAGQGYGKVPVLAGPNSGGRVPGSLNGYDVPGAINKVMAGALM